MHLLKYLTSLRSADRKKLQLKIGSVRIDYALEVPTNRYGLLVLEQCAEKDATGDEKDATGDQHKLEEVISIATGGK